jgi:hypothetical protein
MNDTLILTKTENADKKKEPRVLSDMLSKGVYWWFYDNIVKYKNTD